MEIVNTAKGWAGNRIVPAITSGVLGRSVNPRKADISMYAIHKLPAFALRNSAMFAALKAPGFDR